MSHVDFKKSLCRRVEFKGQGPQYGLQILLFTSARHTNGLILIDNCLIAGGSENVGPNLKAKVGVVILLSDHTQKVNEIDPMRFLKHV